MPTATEHVSILKSKLVNDYRSIDHLPDTPKEFIDAINLDEKLRNLLTTTDGKAGKYSAEYNIFLSKYNQETSRGGKMRTRRRKSRKNRTKWRRTFRGTRQTRGKKGRR